MQIKCDCGSVYFIEVKKLAIDDILDRKSAEPAGIMCVQCKKIYTVAELEAEKSANTGNKEFVLSKWHD